MKKHLLKSAMFLGLTILLFSCKDEITDNSLKPGSPNVEFEYSSATLGNSSGSTAVVKGSAAEDWTIELSDDDFFTVSPMSGSAGDFELTVTTTSDNIATEDRKSSFIFNSNGRKFPVTIIQFRESIKDITFDDDVVIDNGVISDIKGYGETFNFTVSSNLSWNISTDNDWITFEPSSISKPSDEPVVVTVSVGFNENFNSGREGKFSVNFDNPEKEVANYTMNQAQGEELQWSKDLKNLLADFVDELQWDGLFINWDGIEMQGGELVGLNLSGKALNGTFPQGDWSKFPSLKSINLSNCGLTGTVPASLASLPSLETLNLSENNLIGYSDGKALPDEFANLKAKTFIISGNKLSGTVCADFADNENYANWNAMVNIFPQQGDVADSDAEEYNPKNWNFTLTEAGVLRVLYNTMGGEKWSKYKNAYWRTNDAVRANANDGVKTLNTNGTIKTIVMDACGMSGTFPLELAMLKGIYEVDFKNNASITSVHKAYMQNFIELNMNQCKIAMPLNDLWKMLSPNVKTVKMMNAALTTPNNEGISDDILKLEKLTSLSIKNMKLTGPVSKAVQNKLNNFDADVMTGNNFTLE